MTLSLQHQSAGSVGAPANRAAAGQLSSVPEKPAASAAGKPHSQAQGIPYFLGVGFLCSYVWMALGLAAGMSSSLTLTHSCFQVVRGTVGVVDIPARVWKQLPFNCFPAQQHIQTMYEPPFRHSYGLERLTCKHAAACMQRPHTQTPLFVTATQGHNGCVGDVHVCLDNLQRLQQ
jgi:hypothetical protein